MSNKKREAGSVEQLNDMQRYLGEETIEDYQAGLMTRRRMLRRLLLICGSAASATALLEACGDATATTAPASTTAASASTTAASASTTAASATTAASSTTAASATTAAAGGTTAAAGGTTAAAAAGAGGPAPTPGPAKGPLTVAENDPAIEASTVSFDSDTPVSGYMVRPKGSGTYPGVIVIHENRGLTDHIKDVARRVAKAGYIALAPDLVSRMGGTAKFNQDQIAGMLAQAKPEDLVKDLNAAEGFLEKQNGLKTGKIGVVGFCFGGGYTLRLAASNPKIIAAVPYYGPIPQPASIMSTTNAAILGQYGGLDQRVNAGIPDLEKVMKDNGKTYEKKIYDGANHAFNNDTGASYNESASVMAWKATLDWFDKYLKA